MLNTFLAAGFGIVAGNYMLESLLIPMWFGGSGDLVLAGERSVLMVASLVIVGASLRLTKQWR